MPGPTALNPSSISLHLQAGGPLSAEELARRLKVNRVTVQRALRQLEPHVVKLGVTRKTRYALKRAVVGYQSAFRLYRIPQTGALAHEWAELTALHGGWNLSWASEGVKPEWANLVHDHAGYCEGLPFFLTDLRPQGFLGRAAIRQLPVAQGWPVDLRNWSDDHALSYLVQYGSDLPGNLTIGDDMVAMAMGDPVTNAITHEERAAKYPNMAEAVSSGSLPGSSVEGEQPKFTAWLHDSNSGQTEAVIVKFTDYLDTPTGRRWADLLAAEQNARIVLRESSLADVEFPQSEIHDFGNRRYYQISRFDRVGRHGRRGLVSLRSLHDAGFTGVDTNDWAVAAEGLHKAGWISTADLRLVRLRKLFGLLIGNTDMHFGNLAFYLDDRLPLRLAPLYDMLPMLWAPRPGDGSPSPEFNPPPPLPREAQLWSEASQLALDFWNRLEGERHISDAFRIHASNAGNRLRTLRSRFG